MRLNLLVTSLFLIASLACIKVPAEAVLASRAVEESLEQARQMTVMWIEAAYGETRTRMEADLKTRWLPQYQNRLLASLTPEETAQLAHDLQSPEWGKPLQQFQEALMDQYLERQNNLNRQLGEAQKTVIDGVNRWYADLTELQSAITGYLESGREIQESRDQILEGLDGLRGYDPKLDRALDITRGVVNLWQQPETGDLTENLERLLAQPKPTTQGGLIE